MPVGSLDMEPYQSVNNKLSKEAKCGSLFIVPVDVCWILGTMVIFSNMSPFIKAVIGIESFDRVTHVIQPAEMFSDSNARPMLKV